MKCFNDQNEMILDTDDQNRLNYVCEKCNWTTPANHLKIDKIYAYISVDLRDNNEGICGMPGPNGSIVPMVGADKKRMEFYKPFAEMISEKCKMKIELKEFSRVKVLETFEGK